jgi:hypothetical protein
MNQIIVRDSFSNDDVNDVPGDFIGQVLDEIKLQISDLHLELSMECNKEMPG